MGPIGDFVVPNDHAFEESDLAKGSPLQSLRQAHGDESEQLRAIASRYDARATRDRRESHEQESGRESSATDVMLYSFKVSASRVSLPNRTSLTGLF